MDTLVHFHISCVWPSQSSGLTPITALLFCLCYSPLVSSFQFPPISWQHFHHLCFNCNLSRPSNGNVRAERPAGISHLATSTTNTCIMTGTEKKRGGRKCWKAILGKPGEDMWETSSLRCSDQKKKKNRRFTLIMKAPWEGNPHIGTKRQARKKQSKSSHIQVWCCLRAFERKGFGFLSRQPSRLPMEWPKVCK